MRPCFFSEKLNQPLTGDRTNAVAGFVPIIGSEMANAQPGGHKGGIGRPGTASLNWHYSGLNALYQ